MERDHRRDDRRSRDDARNHRPKFEQDRSRSPPRRDRQDDRRRDRSPRRNSPPTGPSRSGRDHASEPYRNRNSGPVARRDGDRPPPRGPRDGQTNGLVNKSTSAARKLSNTDTDTRARDSSEEEDDSDAEMQRLMGFRSFRTTKNTKVPGNDRNYGVYKVKKSEYRQYMNRVGGFNRALSPSRL